MFNLYTSQHESVHPFACEGLKLLPSKTCEAKLRKLLLTKARLVEVCVATLPVAFKVLLISLALLDQACIFLVIFLAQCLIGRR